MVRRSGTPALRTFVLVGVLTLLISGSIARAIEYKPYATPRVTEEQWTAYFQEVKAAHGTSIQEIRDQHLVVFHGGGVSYAFTQPGHPAHPAWITRRIVEKEGGLHIEQIGYFAGSEEPFAKLFADYQALNNRMIEAIRQKKNSPK